MNFLEVAGDRLREAMPDAGIVEGPLSYKLEGTGLTAISLLYGGSWGTHAEAKACTRSWC